MQFDGSQRCAPESCSIFRLAPPFFLQGLLRLTFKRANFNLKECPGPVQDYFSDYLSQIPVLSGEYTTYISALENDPLGHSLITNIQSLRFPIEDEAKRCIVSPKNVSRLLGFSSKIQRCEAICARRRQQMEIDERESKEEIKKRERLKRRRRGIPYDKSVPLSPSQPSASLDASLLSIRSQLKDSPLTSYLSKSMVSPNSTNPSSTNSKEFLNRYTPVINHMAASMMAPMTTLEPVKISDPQTSISTKDTNFLSDGSFGLSSADDLSAVTTSMYLDPSSPFHPINRKFPFPLAQTIPKVYDLADWRNPLSPSNPENIYYPSNPYSPFRSRKSPLHPSSPNSPFNPYKAFDPEDAFHPLNPYNPYSPKNNYTHPLSPANPESPNFAYEERGDYYPYFYENPYHKEDPRPYKKTIAKNPFYFSGNTDSIPVAPEDPVYIVPKILYTILGGG